VLAAPVPPVVEVPQLRALGPRVPLAVLVAEAEHALLRAGLLLVAAGAAEHGIEAALADRAQQRDRLQPVAAGSRAGLLDDAAGVDVVLHARDQQPQPERGDGLVAEPQHLVEVVAGVDVQHGERQGRRPERLRGGVQHHHRVLAAGEQQDGALEGRRDLTEDVHGLRFERGQVR
jgi:hypothetical protein